MIVTLVLVAVALLVAFRLRWHLPGWDRVHNVWRKVEPRWSKQRWINRMNDRGSRPFAPCYFCSTQTRHRRLRTHPETLKRTREPVCYVCDYVKDFPGDAFARQERAKKDWQEMTTPIESDLLTDAMGEQYPSTSRAAIRAFMDSKFERAELHDVQSAGSISASIGALGLGDEIYAETRGDVVVLRRIRRPEKAVR